LDIPESVLKGHLIPKDYDRPRIEIGNYYLKWNDESCGIPQKEVHELKRFITNAIPIFDTSYELLNNFEKPRYKDKYRLYKELSPNIRISNTNRHVVKYEVHMHPDGSTFIDRIEGIEPTTIVATEITKNDTDPIVAEKVNTQQKHRVKPLLYLKWTLGELLFNRQRRI
jgi:hypothetical protein